MASLRSEQQRATQPTTWSEWLLELGKQVERALKRGADIEEVSRKFQSSTETCKLALVFRRSSSVIRLRAMVEDWTREKLITALGGVCEPASKQQAGSR